MFLDQGFLKGKRSGVVLVTGEKVLMDRTCFVLPEDSKLGSKE